MRGPRKKGLFASAAALVKNIFRTRSLIVISDNKVEHLSVSGKKQAIIVAAALAAVCWVSYSTGSFMAVQSVIAEKDQRLTAIKLLNLRMGEDMSALKRDIGDNEGDISEQAKTILGRYSNEGLTNGMAAMASSSETAASNDLIEANARIRYLEGRMGEMKKQQEQMVTAVRKLADNRAKEFETAIAGTGLSVEKLAKEVDKQRKSKQKANGKDEVSLENLGFTGGVGGPYVPVGPLSLTKEEREMFGSLQRMAVLDDVLETIPTGRPIRGAQFMSGFGRRIDPFHGSWANHTGLDLAAPSGARIFSASDGTVVFAGRMSSYGNAIDVDHGFGITTRYGHLSQILVKEGQVVRRGQAIGVQGSTGRSTGAHLHYEVRYHDRPLNPTKFLEAGNNVF